MSLNPICCSSHSYTCTVISCLRGKYQEFSLYLLLDSRSSHIFSEANKEVTVLSEANQGSLFNPRYSSNKITGERMLILNAHKCHIGSDP